MSASKGIPKTIEHRKALSRAMKGRKFSEPMSPERRQAISLGKIRYYQQNSMSQDIKDLISRRTSEAMRSDSVQEKLRWRKGRTKETDLVIALASKNLSKTMRRKVELGEFVNWNKGLTKETDERVARSAISSGRGVLLMWAKFSPEERSNRIKKMWLSACRKPNKVEEHLNTILKDNFPNEWEYVGDGKLIISGLIPDFANINGKKQLIEMFGDYWHKGENPQDRIDKFAKLGYSCLVIWESELKNPNQVIERVANFCKGG